MTENPIQIDETRNRAVLVGLSANSLSREDNASDATLEELADLVETAGGETVLSVQVKLGEDGPEIRQWKTVYNGDWQAEDSLDLWDASDVAAP